jgi:hypothetical protein
LRVRADLSLIMRCLSTMKKARSIQIVALLIAFVCVLAFAVCQHHASPATSSNQATSGQTQASASGNTQVQSPQAQPADANAQTQAAPPPAQTPGDSSQPAAGTSQSAASNSAAQPAAAAPPGQQAQASQPDQSASPPQSSQADQNSQNGQNGGAPAADSAQNEPPQQNQPPQVTIPRGTPVEIRLIDGLGSRRSVTGQRFTATLDVPIVVGDAVVAPRGANVTGRVVYAKRAGRLKGPAQLTLTLTSIEVGGRRYVVATTPEHWGGKSHKKRNFAWIGGGAGAGALVGVAAGGGVGAAIGAGVGAGGGTVTALVTGRKDINLPSETWLRFALRKSVAVGQPGFGQPEFGQPSY